MNNWLSKSSNNLMPWYKVLWCLPFFITFSAGFIVMYLSILVALGAREAERFKEGLL